MTEVGGPLWGIPPQDRRHEVEFLFPERPNEAETAAEEGFVTGYMDLLFRKNDKYYLVDWKRTCCRVMAANSSNAA